MFSVYLFVWFEVGKYNSHYFIFQSTIFDLEFDCFIFNCKYLYSFNYILLRLSIFLAQSKVPVPRRVWNTVIYFLELRSDRNGAKTWLVRPFFVFFLSEAPFSFQITVKNLNNFLCYFLLSFSLLDHLFKSALENVFLVSLKIIWSYYYFVN